jgi:pyruvate dehydrogenase E2 component (dihydrolipoamide acetyltransferase)
MPIIVTMPALSPTMDEGIITSWVVKVGDKVLDGSPICEIATDKSTVEFQAIDGGYIRKILVPAGKGAKVNAPIAIITKTLDEEFSTPTFEEEKKVEEGVSANEKKIEVEQKSNSLNVIQFSPVPPSKKMRSTIKPSVAASPLAKKIAKEKGLDLRSVKGSGPSGRIISKDLANAPLLQLFGGEQRSIEFPDGTFDEVPLSPMRKVIGERLQASKMTIPHYVISQSVEADKMMAFRSELKDLGIHVSFNDCIIKATALALQKHPEINMGYDSKKNVMIQFKTVDISLAVSIPDGLITPILWQANCMSLKEISMEAKRLVMKAKEGKLEPFEYQGGSFTISNLGMFGITSFEAVINPPQGAILAVGGIIETPISKNGKIVSGHRLNLSISLDHRVIDGAAGALFLNTLKFLLENPTSLVL